MIIYEHVVHLDRTGHSNDNMMIIRFALQTCRPAATRRGGQNRRCERGQGQACLNSAEPRGGKQCAALLTSNPRLRLILRWLQTDGATGHRRLTINVLNKNNNCHPKYTTRYTILYSTDIGSQPAANEPGVLGAVCSLSANALHRFPPRGPAGAAYSLCPRSAAPVSPSPPMATGRALLCGANPAGIKSYVMISCVSSNPRLRQVLSARTAGLCVSLKCGAISWAR